MVRVVGQLDNSVIVFCCLINIVASYPLDLVRRRLQVQGIQEGGVKYNGMIDVLRKTVANEGFLGLYKGIGVNIEIVLTFYYRNDSKYSESCANSVNQLCCL